jgi:hypothetical protein
MNKQTANLAIFIATLVAGISCLALGHPELGGALLLGAVGHAATSPFQKPPGAE